MCIDYRFQHQALKLLEKNHGNLDVIALAGGSKNLASPNHEDDKHAVLESIETSVKLHNPETLILTNHLDCGAYGGSKHFTSYEQEISFHKQELNKAKQIINRLFPGLRVEIIFLDLDQKNNVFLNVIKASE